MTQATLGFGAMRLPQTDDNDPTSIDMEEFTRMVDYFMEQGFNYFDTSYAYHDETSEGALKKVLVERYPRESFKIADKIPTWALTNEADNQKFVDIMLERLGTDFFDVLLIHNINESFLQIAENCNTFDYIKRMKEEGTAKKIGISYHDRSDLLEEILEKYGDAIDVVQLQLNYLDWESKLTESRKNYEICEKYGKEVIVMEPIKGGTLYNLPDTIKEKFQDNGMTLVEAALRFAGSHENVKVVLSGMSTEEQLKDNLDTFVNFEERQSALSLTKVFSWIIMASFCAFTITKGL